MHILHVIAGINIEGGGACKYVADLANNQAMIGGVKVTVLTQRAYASRRLLCDGVALTFPEEASGRFRTGFSRHIKKLHVGAPIDVMHVHGIWNPCLHDAILEAKRLRVPCLLAPHGMLEPGALEFSKWKKRIALLLFQRKALNAASTFMATAPEEAANMAFFTSGKKVILSPPGVDLPELTKIRDWGSKEEVKTMLFLSRVHPKKNIISLVKAFAELNPPDWEFLIAGPNEKNYSEEVAAYIEKVGLASRVKILGPVFGKEKEALFKKSSFFALPSLSENFGIVVAEALSYGIPVLTTQATPWGVLKELRLGWWTSTDDESIKDGLREALATSPAMMQEMGVRGRQYVAETFDWAKIASGLLETYKELIRGN
jgi:glycosyltransferase involved in cell wall biosynthesis